MHILFLTDNYPPEVNAPATRTFEHCQEWIKKGHQITVITCAPNFPHGKVYNGYKNKFYQSDIVNNVKVIRVWSYMASNSGFLKRVFDYFSFAFMSFFVGVFQKHDVIIATSPQFFTTWSGWAISKVTRKPWIFELRDLWPESIRTVGAMNSDRTIKFLEKIELALYRQSNKVIVVTDAFKKNLIARGIKQNKIGVVTNGSNMELFYPRAADALLLEDLGLEGKFIVGYIGTHGLAHSLDFIVRSIKKISDPNIYFLFIGDGAVKNKIKNSSKELQLNNILFLDSVSKDEVPRYLSIIDVSLAPLKKNDTFKNVIPSKMFEAAAMGKPTLLGVQGQAQQILERYGAGVCFEPENEKDFVAKLLLLSSDSFYKACQRGCVGLAADYDRKKLANNMLDLVTQTVNRE